MTTIKVPDLSEKAPKPCDGKRLAVRIGAYYEFMDVTEEELAFWNTLHDDEKSDIARNIQSHCFFDLLHELMEAEAEKGEKQKIEDRSPSGGNQPNPNSPIAPPNSPPTPRTPEPPAPPMQ